MTIQKNVLQVHNYALLNNTIGNISKIKIKNEMSRKTKMYFILYTKSITIYVRTIQRIQ